MDQATQENNMPYFFYVTREPDYITISTPRGIDNPDESMDISSHDFAKNYDLQKKLNLLSADIIKINRRRKYLGAQPLQTSQGKGLSEIDTLAAYFSSFADSPDEQEKITDYLMNNELLRIIIGNEILRKEVMKTL